MGNFRELIAYQKSYKLALEIFSITQIFPSDEKYGITSQIRRSSRSVSANLAEAYRRRRTLKHFVSKLNDAETENLETEIWLDFSRDCGYTDSSIHQKLMNINNEVGKLIFYMINNPQKFM